MQVYNGQGKVNDCPLGQTRENTDQFIKARLHEWISSLLNIKKFHRIIHRWPLPYCVVINLNPYLIGINS